MILDRRALIGGTLAATVAPGVAALPPDPTETIPLWPAGPPGAPSPMPAEKVVERSTDPAYRDRALHAVADPRMVVFRPDRPNGRAALVTPGGGYKWVVIDKEGYEVARWLAARGWTVFVLFYRLPGDGWAAGPDIALSDVQRALRLIRASASTYRIRPDRIVAMGFSAGGHVCADLATRFDAKTYAPVDAADMLSARPDLAAPIYPVQSMNLPLAHAGSRERLLGPDPTAAQERAYAPARNVTARTPPTFLLHAEDDALVPVGNTLELRDALKAAQVPVDTHLFAEGGHGFGLRLAAGKPVAIWPELFAGWADRHFRA